MSFFGKDLEQQILKWRESVMLWMLYGSFRNTSCGQASRSNFRTFPRKKNHILHENFEAHHLIQHGQYLRILLERWTKKFTYLSTTYHYIIKQNFCCHCIVDIKLQSQTVSRINKKCMSSNQRRQILKMMTFLQLSKYVLLNVHQFHQNSTITEMIFLCVTRFNS